MKKLFLLLLLLSGFAHAQIINFPDPAFKAKLMTSSNIESVAFDSNGVRFKIDADNDGEISIPEVQAVYELDVSSSGISDLSGIEHFTNLNFLICYGNSLTSLDVSMLNNLENLYCYLNQISNLIINDGLLALRAESNLLTSIDLSNHAVPFDVVLLENNLLTSLTVDSVFFLRVDNNPLATINLTGVFNLISVSFTPLTVLDLSNASVSVDGTLLFSETPLQFLNTKNGFDESSSIYLPMFGNESVGNLYICADEDEIPAFETQLTEVQVNNWLIGSYCSFTPGGYYNTISGTTRFDSNNNGCDANDIQSHFFKVMIDDGQTTGSSFTNGAGGYHFYTNDGNYTLTPAIENAQWFTFTPSVATVMFPSNDNLTATRDFCLTANGVHPDVEIAIVPYVPARPGFAAVYKVVYKNKGNQTLSGTIDFAFNDTVLDFVSSAPTFDSQSTGLLSFNYSGLNPFASSSILITLNVNAPTETPPVNIDDILDFTATINPVSTDEIPLDNSFIFNQTVVGSYDPNDKMCLEGETLTTSQIGNYVHYNINFENTGTADAVNVVVRDTINTAQFDLSSLQLMHASHPVYTRINNNVVEFIFENIGLPPSVLNPIGGHGNVLFKIKTLPTLQAGATVSNTANIYFDYNHPVETNEARTTFSDLKSQEFVTDTSVAIHPNPSKDLVHIKADNPIKAIALFDVQGRILEHTSENKNAVTIDISARAKGIYFVRVTTQKGSSVSKLVKE